MAARVDSGGARAPEGAPERGRAWVERWWPALVVAAIAAAGFALRAATFGDSLFGDELATEWTASRSGLGGVIDAVRSEQELTPPLYYLLASLTREIGDPLASVRLPSLLAGTLAIPLVYLLGARTVSRPAALVGTALFALNQFLIFHSVEARAYMLALLGVLLATLALLEALSSGRRVWWVGYAALSALCLYAHYTTAFTLVVLAAWALWAHPRRWRALALANAAAALAFLPWIGAWLDDARSPLAEINATLAPFTFERSIDEWVRLAVGRPQAGLGSVVGDASLLLVALGFAIAALGLAIAVVRGRLSVGRPDPRSGPVLLVALAVAAPLGAALFSALGNDILIGRNISASLPYVALLAGALLAAETVVALRTAACVLALAGFAIAAVGMLDPERRRPDYEGVASFIDASTNPGAPILDFPPPSPGPPTELEVEVARLGEPHPVLRLGFRPLSPGPMTPERMFRAPADPELVTRGAIREAGDGDLALVQSGFSIGGALAGEGVRERLAEAFGPPRERRTFAGVAPVEVEIYGAEP